MSFYINFAQCSILIFEWFDDFEWILSLTKSEIEYKYVVFWATLSCSVSKITISWTVWSCVFQVSRLPHPHVCVCLTVMWGLVNVTVLETQSNDRVHVCVCDRIKSEKLVALGEIWKSRDSSAVRDFWHKHTCLRHLSFLLSFPSLLSWSQKSSCCGTNITIKKELIFKLTFKQNWPNSPLLSLKDQPGIQSYISINMCYTAASI